MYETDGILAIIREDAKDISKGVFGMGCAISETEVVTCTHVVCDALGYESLAEVKKDDTIFLCFLFANECPVVEAQVDLDRSIDIETKFGHDSDIAILKLSKNAPTDAGIVKLIRGKEVKRDIEKKAYGIRSKIEQGQQVFHKSGEWATELIVSGEQPGGKLFVRGLRQTGISVENGFSGAGVYCEASKGIVGIVSESGNESSEKVAQIIGCDSIFRIAKEFDPFESVWLSKGEPFINRESFRSHVRQLVKPGLPKLLRVKGSRGSGKTHSLEFLTHLDKTSRLDGFSLRHLTIDGDYVSDYTLESFASEVCELLRVEMPTITGEFENPRYRPTSMAKRIASRCIDAVDHKHLLVVDGLDANDMDDEVTWFTNELAGIIHESSELEHIRMILIGSQVLRVNPNLVDTVRSRSHCTKADLFAFFERWVQQIGIKLPKSISDHVEDVFVPINVKDRLEKINSRIKSIATSAN